MNISVYSSLRQHNSRTNNINKSKRWETREEIKCFWRIMWAYIFIWLSYSKESRSSVYQSCVLLVTCGLSHQTNSWPLGLCVLLLLSQESENKIRGHIMKAKFCMCNGEPGAQPTCACCFSLASRTIFMYFSRGFSPLDSSRSLPASCFCSSSPCFLITPPSSSSSSSRPGFSASCKLWLDIQ